MFVVMDLNTYVKTVSSQSALAAAIGVTPAFVWQWVTGRRRITAERCIEIEKVTGGVVTVEELRPDLAWSVVRKPKAA